jgi:RNA polymerase sigma factor (TIGR02999 family)
MGSIGQDALMSDPAPAGITALRERWRAGDEAALHELLPVVQDELRRLARRHMAGEREGHVLQATALVNEAYIRLVEVRRISWHDRVHFFAMAARVMRRILIEYARAAGNQKRGGGWHRVTFHPDLNVGADTPESAIALHDALESLAAQDERKARVVELRYFGGLSVEETAQALGVSAETVMRDWRFAKTWLMRALNPKRSP